MNSEFSILTEDTAHVSHYGKHIIIKVGTGQKININVHSRLIQSGFVE